MYMMSHGESARTEDSGLTFSLRDCLKASEGSLSHHGQISRASLHRNKVKAASFLGLDQKLTHVLFYWPSSYRAQIEEERA